jgi:hypothetical protein
MKSNLIPTKKLALLSAAFCAAMLAFSPNASALAFADNHVLGSAATNPPAPPTSNSDKTDLVNVVIGLGVGGHDFLNAPGALYELNRSDNDLVPCPLPYLV